MDQYDYIIVGSGIAGLYTALLAQGQGRVLLLTKAGINDCSSRHAQGGIAAAIGIGDSPEIHYEDTIAAGAGLCDLDAVRILVDEGPDRITDLINFGVHFDTVDSEVAHQGGGPQRAPHPARGRRCHRRAYRDYTEPSGDAGQDRHPGILPGYRDYR